MLFPIYGFALNWKKVAENDIGKYYIDFDSIKNENNRVYDYNHFKLGVLNPPNGKIVILKNKFSDGVRSSSL